MYMLFFVTILVALIGTYSQVLTNQTAKGTAAQSGAIQSMIQWHNTAASLAKSFVRTGSISTTGCALTSTSTMGLCVPPSAYAGTVSVSTSNAFSTTTYSMPPCTADWYPTGSCGYCISWSPLSVEYLCPVATTTGGEECNGGNGAPCLTLLPQGYSTNYSFYSMAFLTSGSTYVVTHVPPPPLTGDGYRLGLLCLPGSSGTSCSSPNVQLSITFNDLYRQMQKDPALSPMAYGIVKDVGCPAGVSLCLETPTLESGGVSLKYTLPAGSIPAGSIGFISDVTPCSSCP